MIENQEFHPNPSYPHPIWTFHELTRSSGVSSSTLEHHLKKNNLPIFKQEVVKTFLDSDSPVKSEVTYFLAEDVHLFFQAFLPQRSTAFLKRKPAPVVEKLEQAQLLTMTAQEALAQWSPSHGVWSKLGEGYLLTHSTGRRFFFDPHRYKWSLEKLDTLSFETLEADAAAYLEKRVSRLKSWPIERIQAMIESQEWTIEVSAFLDGKISMNAHWWADLILEKYLMANAKTALSGIEISNPMTWNPPRRKRHWTMYLGPTNSGKTYHAMERLIQAPRGAYLAPLRLMALENYDRLVAAGVSSRLKTGEEDRCSTELPPTHISATIETATGLGKGWDVVVVDEVQLIEQVDRGWAWAQAIAQMDTKDLLLCGSDAAEKSLIAMCEELGDTYEIVRLDRLTPLKRLETAVDLREVSPGDAIVAFSKKEVLSYRAWFVKKGVKVSVIYGDLGPENRRREAERFRTGETSLLVATDAIGMGLNLPIQRVLFTANTKHDGTESRLLFWNEWSQIAGRAGRKGMYEVGYYGCLGEAFQFSDQKSDTDGVFFKPTWELVCLLTPLLGWKNMQEVAGFFDRVGSYKVLRSKLWSDLSLLNAVSRTGLPLEMQWTYSQAPVNKKTGVIMEEWISEHDKKEKVEVHPSFRRLVLGGHDSSFKGDYKSSSKRLADLEEHYQYLSLYKWAKQRFPETYPSKVEDLLDQVRNNIKDCLENRILESKCSQCQNPLSPGKGFDICDLCYRNRKSRVHGQSQRKPQQSEAGKKGASKQRDTQRQERKPKRRSGGRG